MSYTYNFITPKTHQYNANIAPTHGMLVIESDDGDESNYTVWLPLCKQIRQKYSQWQPIKPVPVCPNINTYYTNSPTYMTYDQLRELQGMGWEIMSHGRYHTGLGKYALSANANFGNTLINVYAATQFKEYSIVGTEYRIYEGATEEIIRVVSKLGDGVNPGTITIDAPLVNSYTTSAFIVATDEWINDELEGCIEDLETNGITVKSHVYTYHGGSQYQVNQEVIDKISTLFESARGVAFDHNTVETNRWLLQSRAFGASLTTAQIDTILDETYKNNYLTIVYGHGEATKTILTLLEHLIVGAYTRGIKIMTRSEAVKWLYDT